jgi:hypothetical protein
MLCLGDLVISVTAKAGPSLLDRVVRGDLPERRAELVRLGDVEDAFGRLEVAQGALGLAVLLLKVVDMQVYHYFMETVRE